MRTFAAIGALLAALFGLLPYELILLTISMTALAIGSLALARAIRVEQKMDRFLDDQRVRTEVRRSEFDDRLDEG